MAPVNIIRNGMAACRKRGHKMWWVGGKVADANEWGMRFSQAYYGCEHCTERLTLNFDPQPHEQQISGSALWVDCGGKDG